MVTADEIAAIAIFAGLVRGRPRAARARRGGHHARARASTRRTRATSARSSPCSRARSRRSSSSTGSSASSASATPATSSARCRSRSGRSSRSASARRSRRACMRIEPHDYHAVAAVAPDVAQEVGRLAADRMSGPRGLQGIAAEPPPPRAIVVGHRWDADCAELRRFLDRNQITLQVGHAGRAGRRRATGAARCRPTATARRSASSTGKTVVRPQLRRVAELLGLAHRAGRRRVRHRRSSAPGRPGSPPPCTARRRGCARS